jgi:hypothetical protein
VRNLPPDPPDTIRLITTVAVHERYFSFGLSFLIPDVDSADDAWCRGFLDSFILAPAGDVLNCMSDQAQISTCRLESNRHGAPRLELPFPPNHGAHSGLEADAIACGLYVTSGSGRKGAGSRIRFPAVPPVFVDDGWRLSNQAGGYLTLAANGIVAWVATQVGPTGSGVILGTIRRSAHGAPLSTSTFDVAFAVRPSLCVEVVRRRLPKAGRISPA